MEFGVIISLAESIQLAILINFYNVFPRLHFKGSYIDIGKNWSYS